MNLERYMAPACHPGGQVGIPTELENDVAAGDC